MNDLTPTASLDPQPGGISWGPLIVGGILVINGTLLLMAETLGFMLPGSATAPAVSSDRWRFAEATGKRAAEMEQRMNQELERLRAAKGGEMVPYGAYEAPSADGTVSVPIRRGKPKS